MNRRANKRPTKRTPRLKNRKTPAALSPKFQSLNITGQKLAMVLFRSGSELTIEEMLKRGLVKLR